MRGYLNFPPKLGACVFGCVYVYHVMSCVYIYYAHARTQFWREIDMSVHVRVVQLRCVVWRHMDGRLKILNSYIKWRTT